MKTDCQKRLFENLVSAMDIEWKTDGTAEFFLSGRLTCEIFEGMLETDVSKEEFLVLTDRAGLKAIAIDYCQKNKS